MLRVNAGVDFGGTLGIQSVGTRPTLDAPPIGVAVRSAAA
jgi:hypothetical protein